jgi:Mce-associated membrane protein
MEDDMTTSKNSSTSTRSSTAKQAPRRRAPASAPKTRAQTLTADARTAVRSVRTRAGRAMKKVPTDSRTIAIAAGVVAGVVAAGFAIFLNRDRLLDAAATGGDRLRKAADDLTAIAHDRIDQARDNITRFRDRNLGNETPTDPSSAGSIAVNG